MRRPFLRFRIESFEDAQPAFPVYIPQLTRRISKLREMSSVLPKQRIVDRYSSANFVDYQVSNYDIEEAEQAYVKAKELLAELHLALDTVNTTETMDIDIVLED